MKSVLLLAFAAGQLYFMQVVCASDLEITIRTHPREIVLGDPVYIEVTIVNQGKSAAVAPKPVRDLGTFRFEVYNADASLVFRDTSGSGFGGLGEPIQYQPNEPVKHYWYMFAPSLGRLNHPFWRPGKDAVGFYIWGVYRFNERMTPPSIELRSNIQDLVVAVRSAEELRLLQQWASMKPRSFEGGPSPNDLGIKFGSVLTLRETRELSSQLRPGELRDLLELGARLQELHGIAAEQRRPANNSLVDWLRMQPDIKRQALANAVRTIAEANNMSPTLEALRPLIDK